MVFEVLEMRNQLFISTLVCLMILTLVVPFDLSPVHALPNQYWVGSAVSGAWETSVDPKSRVGGVEVYLDVQPTVLYLASEGLFTVFLTFPEDYEYGKEVEEIAGGTIILQFPTQELNIKGFESGDDVLLVVHGTLIDGTTFWGAKKGSVQLKARRGDWIQMPDGAWRR
jgi:hypothetical protein